MFPRGLQGKEGEGGQTSVFYFVQKLFMYVYNLFVFVLSLEKLTEPHFQGF